MISELDLQAYVRATNYISAAQIYLQNNFLLERPLVSDDIKPRLLGHWGTAPGINFIYAHLNRLIIERRAEMLFVLGPGHGFPALQANLFLEGTLGKVYPELTQNLQGLSELIKKFSWPYGFPSHSNPGAPGVIVEGGELGYALGTAYGAALDNPDLIVACVIGDGEAETAATATAWHASKFLNPKTSGAVLPILHLNEFKISGPTIFGRMSNGELRQLFRGYGYEPILVQGTNGIYPKMMQALDQAYGRIRAIQFAARSGREQKFTPFPMVVLKTPKGWTGIKKLHGEKLEGNYLSHQVIAKNAKSDGLERKALERWLRSYRFNELFSAHAGFSAEVKNAVPSQERAMGGSRHARGGTKVLRPLTLPVASQFSEDASRPGAIGSSSMRRAGEFLREIVTLNAWQRNFRFFSPDETYSNKLDAVFAATTRTFELQRKPTDANMSADGRTIEMLSEHTLQGLMQGYVLTGRHAVFASYEAFIHVVSSMVDQYAKFLCVRNQTPWLGSVPSLNYILTSSGWRQEHNGFSHQNPGFVNDMLLRQGCFVHVYFPPDGNSTLVCLRAALASTNSINVIVAGKTLEPRWLTADMAERQLGAGLMIWPFASDPNPHVVCVGIGDYMTKEVLAAIDLVKRDAPQARLRFVNIMELTALASSGIGNDECRAPINLDDYFTPDKPVIVNFHGYPQSFEQILFTYGQNPRRFSVHGYIEHGSTTTPFDMQVRNRTDRYHLAIDILERLVRERVINDQMGALYCRKFEEKLAAHRRYIIEHGVDPDDIENWTWSR